jgi:hypothetical protein
MFIVGLAMLPRVKMPAYGSSLAHEWMPAWVVVVWPVVGLVGAWP